MNISEKIKLALHDDVRFRAAFPEGYVAPQRSVNPTSSELPDLFMSPPIPVETTEQLSQDTLRAG